MTYFNEYTLEMGVMSLFEEQGYVYQNGEKDIHKELCDVLLYDDLRMYLQNKYSKDNITSTEIQRIINKISADVSGNLYEQNRHTLSLITKGFTIKREDSSLLDLFVEVIDFDNVENNIFKIVNQLAIKGNQIRIPDAVVYINGIPLVVWEFKSAVKEDTTIMNAFKQLTVRYRRDIPELFKYNAFVVISDGVNNKFGSLFTPYDFFSAWRKVNSEDKVYEGINSLHTMVNGLFRKDRLLSVIKDFIFIPDSSKKEIKIICRYPQFFATHKLFDSILRHSRINIVEDGKGGTYFGATGCGKSYIMLFLTRMLMKSKYLSSPTIVLITDRTDLNTQLSEQFLNAKEFIGDDNVIEIESREDLKAHLQNRTSGGVFITTIQKFSEDIDLLSERANIVCISDEAHRTQTNLAQSVKITDKGVRRSYGFAKYLRDSFPNATYVGFTGTPIDSTIEVFGDVVDKYSMNESVADGTTKRIVYEGRAAKVFTDSKKLKEIEEYYKQCEKEGANEYQIEESKKASASMDKILGDADRLNIVAKDFVEHYEKRVEEGSSICGKAMFVCSNRKIAYDLYKQIITLRPKWTQKIKTKEESTKNAEQQSKPIERIKLVMTRNKDEDEEELYYLLGTDEERKKLDIEFKRPESNFKIAIVVDMWITGFDVPCLDTMYIDKPIQQHALIQTISRVNRVYEGKDKGLVVDYIGIKNNLNQALKRYAGGESLGGDVELVQQSVVMVKDELDILRRIFYKFNYSKFFSGSPLEQLECLKQASEFIQSTEEQENMFMQHSKRLKQAYNLCTNNEEITNKDVDDIHFFCGVRSIIYKLTKGNAPDVIQMNKYVAQLVEQALLSDGVEEIIQLDTNKSNLDIFSEEYMQRLLNLKYPNTKVKLMEKLLHQVITDFKKVNKIKGVDFSERLNKLVNDYNNRKGDEILAKKVLDELAKQLSGLLQDVNKEKKSFKELGISYEEKAFYDILKSIAKKFEFEYPEEKLLILSKEIKAIVDDISKYTDWTNRDDTKARLNRDLIIVLEKHNYPPITNDEVYKEIFEQAENFKKYNTK